MRAIIYLRVSTEDQVERYGLPVQRRACQEYAKTHGLDVVDVISDEGVSGATMDRAGLSRVRRMVADGLADVVLMLDVDRLSRELAHLLILKPELEKRARLDFVAAKFEDSPSGRMFFGIRGVISQYERELTRERTQRGRIERARSGLIVGGRVPYGYTYADGALHIDEERAGTVRQIYAWVAERVSIREIVRRLRAERVPTWGGKRWGHSSVLRILANETYTGSAHYGLLRREGNVLRRRVNAEPITIAVPVIIERELWERAQAREKNVGAGRPSRRYLLRGLIYCECGRRMSGDPAHNSPAYRCAGRDSLNDHACQRRVLARKIDDAVWAAVVGAFTDPQHLRTLVEQHFEQLRAGDDRLPSLRSDLVRAKRREDNATTMLLDAGPDNRAVLQAKYRELRDERRRIEDEIAQIERAERASGAALSSVESICSVIVDTLRKCDAARRQEALKQIVERVTWDGNTAAVKCGFLLAQNKAHHQDVATGFERVQFVVFARVA